MTGWWFVSMEEQQGWVPSTFLKRKDGQQETSAKRLLPGRGKNNLYDYEVHM